MQKSLILATAGLKTDQLDDIEHRCYPRVDYIELQRLLNVDVINYDVYQNAFFGKGLRYLETQLHSDLYLTLIGLLRRHRYQLVFTMSERAGIPYAGLHRLLPGRRSFVSLIQSWSTRQEFAFTKLNLFAASDAIAVHCTSMKDHLTNLGADPENLHVIRYAVDQHFFRPQPNGFGSNPIVLSLGESRTRDYATLLSAVDGLKMQLVVAASGSWYAREKNDRLQIPIPNNVVVTRRLPQAELRQCYAQSRFVVLPVHYSVASFGATSTLEAASMGRAVIATDSPGIADYIIDGETGILVPPGDIEDMRDAISYLLSHPGEARRMGANARQFVEEELNLDRYVRELAELLQATSSK